MPISSSVSFTSSGERTCDCISSISNTNSQSNYKGKDLAIADSFTNKCNYNEQFSLAKSNQDLEVISFESGKRNKATIFLHFKTVRNSLLEKMEIGMDLEGMIDMAYPAMVNKLTFFKYTRTPKLFRTRDTIILDIKLET